MPSKARNLAKLGVTVSNISSHKPVAVTGATPSLNVGTYNFFDHGTPTANTTVSFASVPTNANWRYSSKIGAVTGTNWDVTTANYSNSSFDLSGQETYPQGVVFKPDGLKMYVVGANNDNVNEYDLSPAWDISTATFLQLFSLASEESEPTGLFFKEDGLKMYIVGATGDEINQYTLSTAWDVTSATATSLFSVSGQETNAQAVFFKTDGTKMYVVGSYTATVYEYNLSTAWDVATASYSYQSFSLVSRDTVPNGIFFRSDGLKMYILGSTNNKVYEYDLSTAWSISTVTGGFAGEISIAAQDTSPSDVFFSPDGTRMFIVGANNPILYQLRVGTPTSITFPASVVGVASARLLGDRITYEFLTADSGTTVNLIAEEKI